MEGKVTDGQQPVSGAMIQLYAAGSGGDGSAAAPLLGSSVLTDSGGNFSITGLYTCPSASAQVYITASGGNPGLATGTANAGLGLMTALGSCGTLSPATNISINEVTTAAATSALAPFASSYTSIGSSSSDLAALQSAFAMAAAYANTATGIVPGVNVPAGYAVPIPQLYTVAISSRPASTQPEGEPATVPPAANSSA